MYCRKFRVLFSKGDYLCKNIDKVWRLSLGPFSLLVIANWRDLQGLTFVIGTENFARITPEDEEFKHCAYMAEQEVEKAVQNLLICHSTQIKRGHQPHSQPAYLHDNIIRERKRNL